MLDLLLTLLDLAMRLLICAELVVIAVLFTILVAGKVDDWRLGRRRYSIAITRPDPEPTSKPYAVIGGACGDRERSAP